MNDFQSIKRLLLPALKGMPIIIGCFVVALLFGYRSILYTNPTYESTAKIKLDDIGQGASSANLYKNFDVFSNTNKIAGEVEVLKSRALIERTLLKLDFAISYFRVGKMRTTEIYYESPFKVVLDSGKTITGDYTYNIHIQSETSFLLEYQQSGAVHSIEGKFGESLGNDFGFLISKNDSVINRKAYFNLLDHYQFKFNSLRTQINGITEHLDITAIDKDVAVIRISYKSEIPEKTSRFVNKHAKTYVEDYIENKTKAAGKTVNFIDDQLDRVTRELQNSETDLEDYRLDNNIINTRQETETDLRKVSQLKIQLANMEMNEAALDSLYSYVHSGKDNFLDLAPNFEAFNDLLSTELIKKIKQYQAEKKDLLIKYTPQEEKVQVVDEKINDIKAYIKESIKNTRKNMHIKRDEIASAIEEAEKVFIGLPTKEKQMIILEREFRLNEKIYNFLTEKRTEAAIVQAANISFHRIIQKGFTPKIPISPRKTLIMIVCGMLGLIIGVSFIYIREFIGGKVRTRIELEKVSTLPIAGIVKQYGRNKGESANDFQSLASHLIMLQDIKKGQRIVVTSTLQREGKTFASTQIAKAFARIGWKVVLVDMNFRKPNLDQIFDQSGEGISDVILNEHDLSEVIKPTYVESLSFISAGLSTKYPMQLINNDKLEASLSSLEKNYDLVVIDSPATAIALDGIKLMKTAHHVFYIVRANFTKSHYLLNSDMIAEEYDIKNIKLILNGVHKATNYSGSYTGSRFNYKIGKLSLIDRIKHYIKIYL